MGRELVWIGFFGAIASSWGCADRIPCLERLNEATQEKCRAVSEEECHQLRRQQLEKIKVWEALTDQERERSSENCTF